MHFFNIIPCLIHFRRKFAMWRVVESSCRPWASWVLCFLSRAKVNQSRSSLSPASVAHRLSRCQPGRAYRDECVLFVEIRGGRGVPGVARTNSRCPGVNEGEEGPAPERRASQSSAGQAASSVWTLSQRPTLRAAPGVLQPDGGGAKEGAAAEVPTLPTSYTSTSWSNKIKFNMEQNLRSETLSAVRWTYIFTFHTSKATVTLRSQKGANFRFLFLSPFYFLYTTPYLHTAEWQKVSLPPSIYHQNT